MFTYKINEVPATLPDSTDATVSIRILNDADTPFAVEDRAIPLYATTIGLPFTRTAAQGLLVNDTNIDNTYGDVAAVAMSVAGAEVGTPLVVTTNRGGTATIQSDGWFSYSPATGFHGDDTFTYRPIRCWGQIPPATVTIRVLPIPNAFDDFITTQEDLPAIGTVLSNDNDTAGNEPLSVVMITNVPERRDWLLSIRLVYSRISQPRIFSRRLRWGLFSLPIRRRRRVDGNRRLPRSRLLLMR